MELLLWVLFGMLGTIVLWVVIRSAVLSAMRAAAAPPKPEPSWTAGIREQPKPTP